MKKLIVLFLLMGSSAVAFCQAVCAFDEKTKELIAANPQYAKDYLLTEQKIKNFIATRPARKPGTPTAVYNIPVVVHVMHTGGAVGTIYNPSDATLMGAITYLNQVYAGTYAGMEPPVGGSAVVDMELKFVLAKRTPTCGSTNGIDRVDASALAGYTAGGVKRTGSIGCTDLELKNFARWNPADYYNIWVVNKIDALDGTTGQFVAGYAYFAGASGSLDGTVMLATQFASGRKTLPHEIGHAFNLYHTFQGSNLSTSCPDSTNCNNSGDLVCDTDPISNNVNGSGVYDFSCRTGTNDCASKPFTKNTEKNFMSYTNCYTLFTAGQKARVQAAMSLPSRVSFINSLGATTCGAVINFNVASDSKTENNAGTPINCIHYTDYNYQLTIGSAPTATATASLTFTGTATKGIDYEVTTNGSFITPSNALTFLAGSSASQPFTIRVFDEDAVESAETVLVNFTLNNGGGNATIGTTASTFSLTIYDNDVAAFPPSVNTQTIGNLSSNLGGALFNSALQSKRVQMLYKATELTAAGFTAGPFTSLSFYIGAKNSTRPFKNLNIKMGGTTLYNLVNGSANVIGNLTTVKRLFTYSTVAGYNDFTLDAPFNWNGTDNIAIELCYDNGTADADQVTDNTYGYSDCGSCPTLGNMFWADGISCATAFSSVNLFYNDLKPIIKLTRTVTGTPVAVALNTATAYLGPNEDVYFYDPLGNIMARIKNLTAFDYGCTTVSIDRAGNGTTQFWNKSAENQLFQKSLRVLPANNTTTGHYQLTLYYTGTEVSNWQTATGLTLSDASVVKVSNGIYIPDITPALPYISDVSVVTATSGAFGSGYTITGDFNNTGFSGFGIGSTGNPILTASFRTKSSGNFTDGSIWQYNSSGAIYQDALQAPGADNNTLVQATHSIDLNTGIGYNIGKTLTIDGILNSGTNLVSGAGNFILSAGATLGIGSLAGISASGATGNIQTAGRTFSGTANYNYTGAGKQFSGSGLPATINQLVIANTGAVANNSVSLSNALTVNSSAILSNGLLGIGANTLTLNGSLSYGTGLISGSALSNLQIGGPVGILKFDQSTTEGRTLNILTVKGTGSATLGSLLLSVNKADLNPGAVLTILSGNKLVTN